MKVSKIVRDFRNLLGDETKSIPDDFIITGLNWAMRDLPLNPKLAKVFAHHFTVELDANKHWRWDLSLKNTTDTSRGEEPFFGYILDVEYLNAWTSTGGDVCPLPICPVTNKELYSGGIPKMMSPGEPCRYTLERDEDKLYIVLDRPSNVPIILDYVAYGIPREVTIEDESGIPREADEIDDEVPVTKLCENVIITALQGVWYQSATDMAFSQSVLMYADNKLIPQLIEEINKRFKSDTPVVLGGV